MFLSDVQARHDKTVELVELMLKLHEDLPKAMTPSDMTRQKRWRISI